MKKIFLILLLLIGTGISLECYAQTGGKKREKRVKTKRRGNYVLTQYKSRGHADNFARGNNGRRSRLARLFGKKHSSWVYKSSGSKRNAYRENQFLLTRSRSQGRMDNEYNLNHQNSNRARTRVKGNRAFRFKKYKSR